MSRKIKSIVTAIPAIVMTASGIAAAEPNEGWKFELTPYLWAFGINGDIAVADQQHEIDTSFSDILDNLDIGGSLLGFAQYNSWITYAQVDYMDLTVDIDRRVVNGEISAQSTIATLGFGYQFQGWSEGQTVDVLIGVRNMAMDNELELDAGPKFSGDRDVTDPLIILRPSFPLSKRWRFDLILSYGTGGDSEYTYDVQPQFQFQAWESGALLFGYRKLAYDIENDKGNGFDGAFEGPFIGLGFTFGGTRPMTFVPPPAPAPAPAPIPEPPLLDSDGDGVLDGKDLCPNTPRGDAVDSMGCGFGIHVEAKFDIDSAVIKPESYAALNRAVELLNKVPSMRGVIEGHTDSIGRDAYNLKLSERRAAAVSEYLVKHGIDAARVPSKGFGEAQPVADNSTEEGRAKNRRVVLRRSDSGS